MMLQELKSKTSLKGKIDMYKLHVKSQAMQIHVKIVHPNNNNALLISYVVLSETFVCVCEEWY